MTWRNHYSPEQWRDAEARWRQGERVVVITRATGIPAHALYYRCRSHPDTMPPRGPARIRPERLQAIRSDWQRGMVIARMAQKYHLHKSRFGQLALQYGWERPTSRKSGGMGGIRPHQGKGPALPTYRRCCGGKYLTGKPCPTCGA